jgi:hypothetical protein
MLVNVSDDEKVLLELAFVELVVALPVLVVRPVKKPSFLLKLTRAPFNQAVCLGGSCRNRMGVVN